MIRRYFLSFLFLIPAIWSISLLGFYALTIFELDLSHLSFLSFLYNLYTYLFGIIVIVILDLFLIIRNILFVLQTKWRGARFIENIYKHYQPCIVLSAVFSSAIVFMIALSMSVSPPVPYDLWQIFQLLFTILYSIVMLLLVAHFPNKRLGATVVLLGLSAVLVIISYFAYGIYTESSPHEIGTFPLDDTNGEYRVNYDGDYWVTYLTKQKVCVSTSKGVICTMEFVKTGNTSITNAPVDLAPFRDKRVRIKGTFKPLYDSVSGEQKQLCIGEGNTRSCKISTGPGSWYASPLQIETITEVTK